MTLKLTERQRTVRGFLKAGLTPRQIAKTLDLSTQRVYSIIRSIEDQHGVELHPRRKS